MQNILLSLIPIFLLILLGYSLKRIKFPNEEFWESADKFTYFVLFPSLLFYKISTASLDGIDGFSFVLSAIITLIIISVVLIVMNYFSFMFEGRAFTSVYQGAVRFNVYVFLALTHALYGDSGIVLAALLLTFLIPTINLMCIGVFSVYAPSCKPTIISILKSIFTNPLILACFLGGAFNFFDFRLISYIEKTLAILSSAALPLGLLSVGVGLHLSNIKEAKMELLSSLFIKLALFPAMIFFVANGLGVSGLPLSILILFGAMPTAPSAYILSRQLGGDSKLMSSIITTEILVSSVTIFVLLQVINS